MKKKFPKLICDANEAVARVAHKTNEVCAIYPITPASPMGEHVDVDVSAILRREMTLDEAGDALLEMVIRTCNGRLTAAEALGHREFVLTKLYRSA